jgi:hypothetical protein
MDESTKIIKLAKQIANEPPWYEDDKFGSLCFFCAEDHPNHDDSCPWKALKDIYSTEKQREDSERWAN